MKNPSVKEKKAMVLYPQKLENRFNLMVEENFSRQDIILIQEAVEYVKEKHSEQYRQEHTPYYTHCLLVAINFMDYKIASVEDVWYVCSMM
jgi:(p)ppGpp synthase/HD superfamily hydrolase